MFHQYKDRTFGQMVGGVNMCYAFDLLLEICGENEDFKKYSNGGEELKRKRLTSLYSYMQE